MRHLIDPSVVVALLTTLPVVAMGQDHEWLPQPDNAAIMVISSHPDDEGIFFGGTIPYYTQVRNLPTVHISMTSGDWGLSPEVREEELRNADWDYGLRNEPLFPRFKDAPTQSGANGGGYANSIDATWDWWNDGELDGQGSGGQDAVAGKQKAIDTLATYIRTYTPDVIVSHDLDGEYGHDNHKATGIATADAFDRAADANYVDGNAPWQAKKLYAHQSEANGLGTTGYAFENWLFHDFWEETSIDSNGDGTVDTSPRLTADVGLDQHFTQGSHDASTVYRTDEGFDGHHSEWWGLLESTVGPDSRSTFTIEGYDYQSGDNWAVGDFFEHIDLSGYFPFFGDPGDINGDGFINGDGSGASEEDDVTAYVLGWKTSGHATLEEQWRHGDMNFDGITDLADWFILREHHETNLAGIDLAALFAKVPEPSTVVLALLLLPAIGVAEVRRRRRAR